MPKRVRRADDCDGLRSESIMSVVSQSFPPNVDIKILIQTASQELACKPVVGLRTGRHSCGGCECMLTLLLTWVSAEVSLKSHISANPEIKCRRFTSLAMTGRDNASLALSPG
jgi:hypothetical protein